MKWDSLSRRCVLFSSHFSNFSSRLFSRSLIESPSAGLFSVSESLDVLISDAARGLVGICSNGAFSVVVAVGVLAELLVDDSFCG